MKSSPRPGPAQPASFRAADEGARCSAARRRARLRRGFTVLEALIALTIVGFAVVATIEALGGGLRAEGQVSRHLEAVALAETRMNELGVIPRDSLRYYVGGREGVFAPPFERYAWRAAIEPVTGSRSLLRATVTVAWEGRSYALESVFYRGGAAAELLAAAAAVNR